MYKMAQTRVEEMGKVSNDFEDSLDGDNVDNREDRRSLQPRIVMFDDSASNDSNPFMISCFYSLAASPDLDQNDNAEGDGKEINDVADKGVTVDFPHDKDEVTKSKQGHEIIENSKLIEISHEIGGNTKFSKIGHSSSENTEFNGIGQGNSENTEISNVDDENSENAKLSELGNRSPHFEFYKQNKTNGINQTLKDSSEVSMATDDEYKDIEYTNRSDVESQNILPVNQLEKGNRSDKEINENCGTKTFSDLKLEKDNELDTNTEVSFKTQQDVPTGELENTQESLDNISGENTLSNDSQLLDGDNKCGMNVNKHCSGKKSRKQNVPKRILRDSKKSSVSLDTDSESDSSGDLDKKVVDKSVDTDNEKEPTSNDIYIDIDDIEVETDDKSIHSDSNNGKNYEDHFDDRSSEIESNIKKTVGVIENKGDSVDSEYHSKESTELFNPSQSQLNSIYFGLSTDFIGFPNTVNEIGNKSNTASSFALDENGPENLEVIRQLREIRCNKYRKISMLEKREIAGYASAHGVSQAAAFYNVSKSSVSMWTKLDFSKVDEDSLRNKRNCMIGNEKFESLCRRIQADKEWKFKNVSKHDKFEVSRYAKLVGVREMSRCLDIALGTISGWMRQFPYKLDSKLGLNENIDDNSSDFKESDDNSLSGCEEFSNKNKLNNAGNKERLTKAITGRIHKRNINVNIESTVCVKEKYETVQDRDSMYVVPVSDLPVSDLESGDEASAVKRIKLERSVADGDNCSKSNHGYETNDEVDQMISETLQKHDTTKCFDDVKSLIHDTPLVDDDYFKTLFDRVIACKADKYKSLKPSEKLEVVRYSKRVGVRRIAKILGLATGTLSGWTTKYQSSLGLTDPSIDNQEKPDLLVTYLGSNGNNSENQSTGSTSSTILGNHLDNKERSEVTAVKLLFKDNYELMLKKIELAKQIKFRNVSKDEKIEFVKCSKLVGIRPTARVFCIPIGTLSGWITKYSQMLHPAYHIEGDVSLLGSVGEPVLSSHQGESGIPHVVGRNPEPKSPFTGLQSGLQLERTNGWPNVPSLTPVASNSSFSYLNQTGLQNSDNGNDNDGGGDDYDAKIRAKSYLKTVYQSLGLKQVNSTN